MKISWRLVFGGLLTIGSWFLCGCQLANGPIKEAVLGLGKATVQFHLSSFPAPDGTYSVSGGFGTDENNNTSRTFSLVNHAGTAGPFEVTSNASAMYLNFQIVKAGTWERPWYTSAGKFALTDDNWDHLVRFVILVPLDGNAHVVDLSYPTGFVLPKITLDGTAPSNLTIDAQGRITQVKSPDSFTGTVAGHDDFAYNADGTLATWTRHYGYRIHTGYPSNVISSVWTYNSSGFLARAEDTGEWGTMVTTFRGTKPDWDGNPLVSGIETRADGTLRTTAGPDGGETAWTEMNYTPQGGTALTTTVPSGSLAMFQGYCEGWVALKDQWKDGDLSTGVELIDGDPGKKVLKASFKGRTDGAKTAVFFYDSPRLRDWAAYNTVLLTITNPGTQDLNGDFVVKSGAKATPQSSGGFRLPAGTTQTIFADLRTLNSEATGWGVTPGRPLANADDVRGIVVKVSNIGLAGFVLIKEMRLLSRNS